MHTHAHTNTSTHTNKQTHINKLPRKNNQSGAHQCMDTYNYFKQKKKLKNKQK